jgi:hypothetical protein
MHVRPVGFTAKRMFEIKNLIDQVEKLAVGSAPNKELDMSIPPPLGYGDPRIYRRRRVYSRLPHITCGNHFSGDNNELDYAGQKGFGITQTCRQDQFFKGLKEYLQHEQVNAGDARPKAMRFENPIVVVKQVPAGEPGGIATKPYTKTLVTFQSVGATNISGVNNLPLANLYVTIKSRGKTPNRRYWGIEQNEARATYLGHIYGVNNVDHIKNVKIRYTTWKYWHAPFLHPLSIADIAVYDTYLNVARGGLTRSGSSRRRTA